MKAHIPLAALLGFCITAHAICSLPGANFGIPSPSSINGSTRWNVYNTVCAVVDGLDTTGNPCDAGIFGCSPAPIFFDHYTSSITGLVYICLKDPNAEACGNDTISVCCGSAITLVTSVTSASLSTSASSNPSSTVLSAPASSTVFSTPTSSTVSSSASTRIRDIAGGAVGAAVGILLIGLGWWMVRRRNRTGERASLSLELLGGAGPQERGTSVDSRRAPPMQHADTDVAKVDIQLSPAVELYGQRMDTPSSAVLLPQDYNKETPTRMIDAPEQIHQARQQVEDSEQGGARTSFTSDSKMVMSWEPPSTQQGSTSGSTTSPSLEQRLRALEMRATSIDEGPPSYDTKS